MVINKSFIFIISLVGWALAGCGRELSSQEKTGSISFALALQKQQAPTLDCDTERIRTIRVNVLSADNTKVASADFNCTDHRGVVNNVSSAAHQVIVQGFDAAGGLTHKGIRYPVAVSPGEDKDLGTVVLTPIALPLMELFPQADAGTEFAFKDPDTNSTFQHALQKDCFNSDPSALQITYDMTSEKSYGGWGVHWNEAPAKHFDASSYKTLVFRVRGRVGGELFEVGLKDTSGTSNAEKKVQSTSLLEVTTTWTTVMIPFTQFTGVNTASLNNLNFGFNKNHKAGMICVDDIAFVP